MNILCMCIILYHSICVPSISFHSYRWLSLACISFSSPFRCGLEGYANVYGGGVVICHQTMFRFKRDSTECSCPGPWTLQGCGRVGYVDICGWWDDLSWAFIWKQDEIWNGWKDGDMMLSRDVWGWLESRISQKVYDDFKGMMKS